MHARFSSLLATILLGTFVSAHGTSRMHKVIRSASSYTLQDLYKGAKFFAEWSFFVGPDPTGGNVNYVNEENAATQHLAYVDPDGAVVLAVDAKSKVQPGGKRNSVRITSNKVYNGGLFILDAAAMPVGCGTWPAFWTVGPNWPAGGEIDIVEGVNNQAKNQMTLHTGTQTCTLNKNGQFTGQALNTQCHSTPTSDSGCSILDSATNSFGPGFNAAGGGVFAFLWDAQVGMSMWHFPRSNIPTDISNGSPTPSKWGEPAALWSADSCKISDDFKNHQMVLDITICGSWAGSTGAYRKSGCPGTCSDIVANAANFADAKWVVKSVAVYQPSSSSSLLPI